LKTDSEQQYRHEMQHQKHFTSLITLFCYYNDERFQFITLQSLFIVSSIDLSSTYIRAQIFQATALSTIYCSYFCKLLLLMLSIQRFFKFFIWTFIYNCL